MVGLLFMSGFNTSTKQVNSDMFSKLFDKHSLFNDDWEANLPFDENGNLYSGSIDFNSILLAAFVLAADMSDSPELSKPLDAVFGNVLNSQIMGLGTVLGLIINAGGLFSVARYLVADIDGKIVGYVGIWFVAGEGHITNVAVHSDYRGQKIGDILIKHLVKICKDNNIFAMTLEVRVSNIVAQNLYKKYGFKLAGIRKEYYSDNKEDAMIMWSQLKEV